MAIQLQLRNGTVAEWVTSDPILGEAEIGVITDSKMFVIGDGKTKYADLQLMPFGKGVYEVMVQYGYKGTREDFCRQLDLSLKNPEQQVGTLANAGAGWNSFTFPKEFSEDVYVTLSAQDVPVFGVLKNITRQGFHYCLYDASGNTVGDNVVVNYIAVAASELNLAQAIAQSAGLNPFDFDNLMVLFTDHAAEVVANEAAFNLTKHSGMASGRYICHLTGLSPITYHNTISLAGDEVAMNVIGVTESALSFIVVSPGAYDSIRLSTMAMSKYVAGLVSFDPQVYMTVDILLEDFEAMTAVIASSVAMTAVAASSVAMTAVAASSVAMTAVIASSVAMTAVAASSVARSALWANQPTAMAAINAVDMAITKYVIGCLESSSLKPENFVAMAAVAGSAVAMAAVAGSAVAMAAVAGSAVAMAAVAGSAVAMAAVAGSAVAMAAVYNKAAVTEPILAGSAVAMAEMRKTAIQVQATLNQSWQTLHEGKAFVIEIWENNIGQYQRTCGDYIVGASIVQHRSNTTTEKLHIGKFASQVRHVWSTSSWVGYALIFKI